MNNVKKTITVTGATGFIGRNLIKSLLEDDHKVIAVIRDPSQASSLPSGCIPSLCSILDYEPVAEIVSRSDLVFHLAGIVGVGPAGSDPYKTIDTNVLGTVNIMDAAKYFKKPVVYTGVGNIDDHSIYTVSKMTSERFLMMYNKEHGCDFLPVRIFNVYGPGQSLKSGKLIINSIHKALVGEPISIFGKGDQVMDFIYIEDVIMHLKSCVDNYPKFETNPFEIGSGKGTSILDAVNMIIMLTGGKSKIVFENKRSGDRMQKVIADSSRFISNSVNLHSFEKGVKKTIKYIKDAI